MRFLGYNHSDYWARAKIVRLQFELGDWAAAKESYHRARSRYRFDYHRREQRIETYDRLLDISEKKVELSKKREMLRKRETVN
jgi:hypothetical protein